MKIDDRNINYENLKRNWKQLKMIISIKDSKEIKSADYDSKSLFDYFC